MFETRYAKTDNFSIEKSTFKMPQHDMHYHHTHEIYYAIDGERDLYIEDDFFKIKAGDLAMIPANCFHRASGKGALRFLLYFNDECLKKILKDDAFFQLVNGKPLVFRPDVDGQAELKNIFSCLIDEYNKIKVSKECADDFILSGQLFNLLFFIRTHENNYVNIDDQPVARMRSIIEYIHENYSNPLTLQEIADEFGITKDHLCHIFTQNMGMSLFTYLNIVRVKKACEIIKTSDVTLLEVALSCGFCSYHYFCRIFKREKGISPSEYRKQIDSK